MLVIKSKLLYMVTKFLWSYRDISISASCRKHHLRNAVYGICLQHPPITHLSHPSPGRSETHREHSATVAAESCCAEYLPKIRSTSYPVLCRIVAKIPLQPFAIARSHSGGIRRSANHCGQCRSAWWLLIGRAMCFGLYVWSVSELCIPSSEVKIEITFIKSNNSLILSN